MANMDPKFTEVSQVSSRFKAALVRKDYDTCTALLSQLKVALTEFKSLPPLFENTPNAVEELSLARDIYEHAVVLSVKTEDKDAFERDFFQLKPYYTDARNRLSPSPQEYPILGLNLLRLLVQNRIAEFHTELELLSPSALENPCIRHAIELEQSFMEGAYNRVLSARQTVPHETYVYFIDLLAKTIRDEIAGCSEKAYDSLSIKDAQQMLLFSSEQELLAYIEEDHLDWEVNNGLVIFQRAKEHAPCKEIPSLQLINQTLGYARELERIVDKPLASRSTSAEIYVLGFKYKAPAKIDPQLLDVKHLFERGKEPPKVVDVLCGTKQKRHRDGYEDRETILRKVSSAADFIWSETPLDILGSVTTITFEDPASLPIKDHSLTTEEVKALCDDLRVLGKQDFKHLLKWRMHVRKAFSPSVKATSAPEETGSQMEEDDDEKVLNEMEELTYAMEQKKKKAKKLNAKRRAKDKARKALGMQSDSAVDNYTDQELFSLASIKGKKDLVTVDNNEYEEEAGESGTSDIEQIHDEAQDDASTDLDSDEERRRYDEQVEQLLDEAYEQYVVKKEGKTKQRKRAKKNEDGQLFEGNNDNDMIHSDQDSDNDLGDHEVNPLVVPLVEDVPTQEEIAAKWFSQDIFTEPNEGDVLRTFDSDDEKLDGLGEHPKRTTSEASKKQRGKRKMQDASQQVQFSKASEDFEVVPAPPTDSSDSSSSDGSDEDDIETKAEILAYAKKMLSKKQREEILDDAYNKYMHHDAGLPKWFVDEEKKHNQPIKPITKEEIAAMRAQFKEIDARPAKKVAEAKARKKRATLRKLEKVRKKANFISDQADISDHSKTKMIEQLYSKAMPKRPKKEYVVAKKGIQVKAGKGKVLVDRRMKKDARSHALNKKGKGKKGKQKGKGSEKSRGKVSRKGNKG